MSKTLALKAICYYGWNSAIRGVPGSIPQYIGSTRTVALYTYACYCTCTKIIWGIATTRSPYFNLMGLQDQGPANGMTNAIIVTAAACILYPATTTTTTTVLFYYSTVQYILFYMKTHAARAPLSSSSDPAPPGVLYSCDNSDSSLLLYRIMARDQLNVTNPSLSSYTII